MFHRQVVRPREQAAARCRLLRGVRLKAAPSRWCHQAHEAKPDECFQARQQLQDVVRLHHLSEGNQRPVDGRGPARQQCLLEQEVCRLHRLNGGDLNQVHDRSPV